MQIKCMLYCHCFNILNKTYFMICILEFPCLHLKVIFFIIMPCCFIGLVIILKFISSILDIILIWTNACKFQSLISLVAYYMHRLRGEMNFLIVLDIGNNDTTYYNVSMDGFVHIFIIFLNCRKWSLHYVPHDLFSMCFLSVSVFPSLSL